ncbi:MAG: NMD3-related protein [Promethearchaeota archaeon]
MARKFCAICGKDLDDSAPHFGMCIHCYSKEHPLFELPGIFIFKICIDCGKYTIKEEWFESQGKEIFAIIEDAIRKFLLKSYSKAGKINFSISFDKNSFVYSSKNMLKSIKAVVEGMLIDNVAIKHRKNLQINVEYDLCKNCSNIRGGTYYLSIIQLRVKDETEFDIIAEILEKIHHHVEVLFEKDPRQYISKVEDQKYGVDLYLSTNELMNHIIKYLRANYHFILKRTKKLVGRDSQKGRNLYRLKSLIKILPLHKNDTVFIEEKKFYVDSISKSKVILRNPDGDKLIKDYSFFFK